ncbi:MAG TPA: hypothetical protein VJJ23_03220 [Candidatus Nanoarchaeia archaeon]|nr:hypothetical protein [Candidatus Nanoarchaeia archaeon]
MNKRGKFVISILFMLIISIIGVNAQTEDAGFQWLNKSVSDVNWKISTQAASWSILALGKNNYNVDSGVDVLLHRRNLNGGWNNNVKDSSLAILALEESDVDISKSVEWLLKKQQKANTDGSWLIQIKTENEGSCEVSVDEGDTKTFTVDNNKVSCDFDGNGDGYGNWIDLEGCGGFSLKAYSTVDVNCNNLGSADINLIYKNGNNYYLLQDKKSTNRFNFEIENSYFGDYESTLIATWMLNEIGEIQNVHTLSYLEGNIRDNFVLDRALLYGITKKDVYKNWVEAKQNNFTGSLDGNVYNTALVILNLKGSNLADKATDWIKNEQNTREQSTNYGSWGGSVEDTAIVLYSAFTAGGDIIIDDGVKGNVSLGNGVCGDSALDADEECDASYDSKGKKLQGDDRYCQVDERCVKSGDTNECSCKKVSLAVNETRKEICDDSKDNDGNGKIDCLDSGCRNDAACTSKTQQCNNDKICDTGESCLCNDCRNDIRCKSPTEGDQEICDDGEDNDGNGDIDCKDTTCKDDPICKKKGFPWWIVTIVVLVIAFGLIYYFVFSKRKPKEKKPFEDILEKKHEGGFKMRPSIAGHTPQKQQPQRFSSYRDEELEKELDKSLKKAREIITKK